MPHQCTACGRSFADGSKQMLAGCPDCGGNKFQFLPDAAAPTTEPADDDIIEAPTDPDSSIEDRAQATARSAIVSDDELPPTGHDDSSSTDTTPHTPSQTPPDLSELRQELNDQFESIKILQPGEYELNLMELYDRDEYIIALEEDGRYVIDVPSSWRED